MFNLLLIQEYVFNGYKDMFLDITSLSSVFAGIMVITSKNPIVSILFLIGLFLSISFYLILLGFNFIGLSYLLVYIGAVSILFLFILMLINVRISELLADSTNSLVLLMFIITALYVFISNIIPVLSVDNKMNKAENLEYVLSPSPLNTITILNNSGENYLGVSENNSIATLDIEVNRINFNNSQENYFGVIENNSIATHDIELNGINLWNYVYEAYKYNVNYVTSLIWDSNLAEHSHIASIGNIIYTSYSIWLLLTSIILLLAMVGCIVITIKRKTA